MATELLMEISQDERQRAIMRSRRMFETDRMSDLKAENRLGREEGVKIGRVEGKIEGKIEGEMEKLQKIVNNMYKKGFDVKTIAQATDTSEQDVKDILNSKEG